MALPFDLPALSRGFAELTPAARAVGAAVTRAAAQALSSLFGFEVHVSARATPARAPTRAPAARVGIDLTALPATALLEVEPGLVVALVDRLAGGSGDAGGASSLTPVEVAALELFALAAVDAACSVAPIEERLAPRIARGCAEPGAPLAVELDVAADEIRGRARLLLPPAAVRALSGSPCLDVSGALALPVSIRRGEASVSAEDLEALAPGDVLVLDDPRDERAALVLPGGFRADGRLEDGVFRVEEIGMTERRLEIPIRLEVELARVELTLADLARLEPGAAIPLGLDRRGLVTLRAGERAIARGELVDVDGAIGVRIISVEVAP